MRILRFFSIFITFLAVFFTCCVFGVSVHVVPSYVKVFPNGSVSVLSVGGGKCNSLSIVVGNSVFLPFYTLVHVYYVVNGNVRSFTVSSLSSGASVVCGGDRFIVRYVSRLVNVTCVLMFSVANSVNASLITVRYTVLATANGRDVRSIVFSPVVFTVPRLGYVLYVNYSGSVLRSDRVERVVAVRPGESPGAVIFHNNAVLVVPQQGDGVLTVLSPRFSYVEVVGSYVEESSVLSSSGIVRLLLVYPCSQREAEKFAVNPWSSLLYMKYRQTGKVVKIIEVVQYSPLLYFIVGTIVGAVPSVVVYLIMMRKLRKSPQQA